MINKYETLDDLLKKKYSSKKNVKPSKIKEKSKKSKKHIARIVAIILAGTVAISSGIIALVSHFKNKNKDIPKTPNSISTMEIGNMGTELEFPEEPKTNYGETTGNVDVNKIVEKNGKIYVDKDSADKSNQVGNSSVDTKGGSLKVEKDGTVKDKNEGYEIKNETGSVIQKGDLADSDIPDGFEKNEQLGGIYEIKDETGNLTYADATYYDKEGNVVINKGELVSKETLENAQKHLLTTKTTSSNTSSTASTVTSSNTSSTASTVTSSNTSSTATTITSSNTEIKENGTYKINGLIFESKDDYEQWVLQGYEGYAEVDGVMKSEEELQKVLQKTK